MHDPLYDRIETAKVVAAIGEAPVMPKEAVLRARMNRAQRREWDREQRRAHARREAHGG